MESMCELSEQALSVGGSEAPTTSTATMTAAVTTELPLPESTTEPSTAAIGGAAAPVNEAASATATNTVTDNDLIGPADLSPTISRSDAVEVSVVSNMIDSSDFRSQMPEPTYHTLNGRMSPCYNNNSYATLTPLQPLPPISTVSDKFGASTPNVSGNFTFMPNNVSSLSSMPGMDMNSYRYDKLGTMGMNVGPPLGASPTMPMMSTTNYVQPTQQLAYTAYNHNGLPSPKTEQKPMLSPNHSLAAYDTYSRGLVPQTATRLHSPNPVMQTTLNGLHQTHINSSPIHSHAISTSRIQIDRPASSLDSQGSKQEVEEINTKELAQKISSELKRYSIPQAVFAQRVLCRSQGTLSDLLRNPKPWSKLKSGRETFRRMWKWLQEPEFQRMSALRLAGKSDKVD